MKPTITISAIALLGITAGIIIYFTMPYTYNGDYFMNPYEEVNWNATGYYDSNLHTHTTLSDGSYDPHQAIDMYHELDYHILALTDHDTHHHDAMPTALYPWTELNDIYFDIRGKINPRYDLSYEERANEEWQNRDPQELGMLSIEGSELSAGHHIGSLMNNYAGANPNETESIKEVGNRDGLAMFFHPGRYDRDTDWYVNFYETYPHVIGQEIYNQTDRYPMDRDKWDAILHQLMPDRPVWGFANDDTHATDHFGRNRNVFLIEDLSVENVRFAIQKGHLFLYIPEEIGDRPDLMIRDVNQLNGVLSLAIEGEYSEIQWITHNPETGESTIFATGSELSIDNVPESASFVRPVIISKRGRTYIQPFGIVRV